MVSKKKTLRKNTLRKSKKIMRGGVKKGGNKGGTGTPGKGTALYEREGPGWGGLMVFPKVPSPAGKPFYETSRPSFFTDEGKLNPEMGGAHDYEYQHTIEAKRKRIYNLKKENLALEEKKRFSPLTTKTNAKNREKWKQLVFKIRMNNREIINLNSEIARLEREQRAQHQPPPPQTQLRTMSYAGPEYAQPGAKDPVEHIKYLGELLDGLKKQNITLQEKQQIEAQIEQLRRHEFADISSRPKVLSAAAAQAARSPEPSPSPARSPPEPLPSPARSPARSPPAARSPSPPPEPSPEPPPPAAKEIKPKGINVIYNNTVASRVLARALDTYKTSMYEDNLEEVKKKVKFFLVWRNQDNKVVVSISESGFVPVHPEIHFESKTLYKGNLDSLQFNDPFQQTEISFTELKNKYQLAAPTSIKISSKGNESLVIKIETRTVSIITTDKLYQMNAESLVDDFAIVMPDSVTKYDDLKLNEELKKDARVLIKDITPGGTFSVKTKKVDNKLHTSQSVPQVTIASGVININFSYRRHIKTHQQTNELQKPAPVKQTFETFISTIVPNLTIPPETAQKAQKGLVELLNNCYRGKKDSKDFQLWLTKQYKSQTSIFFAMRLYHKSGSGTFISFYVSGEQNPEEYPIYKENQNLTNFCQEVKVQLLTQISILQALAKKEGKNLVLVKVNDVPIPESRNSFLQVEWERTLYKSEPTE